MTSDALAPRIARSRSSTSRSVYATASEDWGRCSRTWRSASRSRLRSSPRRSASPGCCTSSFPPSRRDERVRVERSLAPTVNALRIFALVAATATFVLCGFIVTRIARRNRTDGEIWSQPGATRGQRAATIAVGPLLATVLGGLGALGVGRLAADLGPVASAKVLAPSGSGSRPDRRAARAGRHRGWPGADRDHGGVAPGGSNPHRTSGAPVATATRRCGEAFGAPSVHVGFRAATTGSGADRRAAVDRRGDRRGDRARRHGELSANLRGSSRSRQRSAAVRPRRRLGFGYGGSDVRRGGEDLDRDDVKRWGIAATGTAVVNGEAIPMVAGMRDCNTFPPTMVSGRPPHGPHEVDVGGRTRRTSA